MQSDPISEGAGLKFRETFPPQCCTDVSAERRSRKRLNVRLPMLIFVPGVEKGIAAESQNVSTDGFYLVTDGAIAVGDQLRCLLLLTQPTVLGDGTRAMCLEFQAEVVHVAMNRDEASVGVGCAIREFCVLPGSAWRRQATD
jgi:hypothetical protein